MSSIELKAYRHEQGYGKGHRKKRGTHYTPDAIVDFIVTRLLKQCKWTEELLRTIRILDPACGSGLFLLKAFDILAIEWKECFGQFNSEDAKYLIENSLFGIDIDKKAVTTAKQLLLQKASIHDAPGNVMNQNIVAGDALSLRPPSQTSFNDGPANPPLFPDHFAKHSFDFIIGNPPYVRIQNIPVEQRIRYAAAFSTAAGRFDMANLFLELSEHLLKDQGELGFIVSNKLFSTAGTKKVRDLLLAHFAISDIVDLSDTKLFGAAVLPLILIARRTRKPTGNITYSAITELFHSMDDSYAVENIFDFITSESIPFQKNVKVGKRNYNIQKFYAATPSRHAKIWSFHNEREKSLLSKLKVNSLCCLADICEKISVGLKTTADGVFIKPMTKDFVEDHGLENDLIHPVLESHNIARWKYNWNHNTDLHVLYPHEEANGGVIPIDLARYPQTKQYLESNYYQLSERTYILASGRKWYEIWVHQSPGDFNQRKLITPDISSRNRFAIDEGGFYVNGTCFYLILKDKSDISYYSTLGLLNSSIMEYYHKLACGNSLYAKRYRYWTSYIGSYPIASKFLQSPAIVSRIAENVRQYLNLDNHPSQTEFEQLNNKLCYQLYDLTVDEISDIKKSLSINRAVADEEVN